MKKIVIFFALALFCIPAFSQNTISADTCLADFQYLVKQLETAHPDPYMGFGGKVFFKKAVNAVEEKFRNEPQTVTSFVETLSAFMANMHDGHSWASLQGNNYGRYNSFLPIKLSCSTDGVYACILPKEHSKFLGARLLEVNGHKLEELLDLAAAYNSCENLYSRYKVLCNLLTKSFVQKFSSVASDSAKLLFQLPDNQKAVLTLGFISRSDESKIKWNKTPKKEGFPEKQLAYSFIDDKQQVMMFKVRSVSARENLEFELNNRMEGAYEDLQWYYASNNLGEMPKDTLAALQGVPSFSGTFAKMLEEMKAKNAPYLVIDLRQNGGGWTPIVQPTLYQLYGDEYVTKDMQIEFARLLSPLYLKKINSTLEKFNKDNQSNYAVGDYIFTSDYMGNRPIEEARKSFIDNSMCCDKSLLEKQQGKPLYSPKKVYVITDVYTFSAAFHYAFYLWKMGAVVVGVPCEQAPNTFMETTPYVLPLTKVSGSISNSMQVFLPANDKRSQVFWPDLTMKYDDYKRYNFDQQAEILYLLDHLNDK